MFLLDYFRWGVLLKGKACHVLSAIWTHLPLGLVFSELYPYPANQVPPCGFHRMVCKPRCPSTPCCHYALSSCVIEEERAIPAIVFITSPECQHVRYCAVCVRLLQIWGEYNELQGQPVFSPKNIRFPLSFNCPVTLERGDVYVVRHIQDNLANNMSFKKKTIQKQITQRNCELDSQQTWILQIL